MITVIAVMAAISLSSCDPATVYHQYRSIDRFGWSEDSVLTFEVVGLEPNTPYDLSVHVRHTDVYSYQNLWLFVGEDTVDVELANDRGLWLGKHSGSYYEVEVPIRQEVVYTADTNRVEIRHGMREIVLTGVTDIGLKFTKHGKE